MTTPDTLELRRKAEAVGRVEWHPGHLCSDDHPCDCAYIFDEGHMGGIATIHVSNDLPVSEGGNDAPSRDLAKAHQAFIAAANPAVVLALLDRLDALEGREAWQPIETAPRDGTPILIWQGDAGHGFGPRSHHMPAEALRPKECSYSKSDPRLQWYDDKRWAVGYWRPWGGWGNRNSSEVNPTHWRPLPEAPTTLADEGRDAG